MSDDLIPDEHHANDRVYLPVLAVTVAWYLVPAVLVLLWSALFGGGAAASVCPPAPAPCSSDGGEGGLVDALPWLGLAVLVSLLAAVLLRMIATTWRAISTGTAAAVIGAGMSTLSLELLT